MFAAYFPEKAGPVDFNILSRWPIIYIPIAILVRAGNKIIKIANIIRIVVIIFILALVAKLIGLW